MNYDFYMGRWDGHRLWLRVNRGPWVLQTGSKEKP